MCDYEGAALSSQLTGIVNHISFLSCYSCVFVFRLCYFWTDSYGYTFDLGFCFFLCRFGIRTRGAVQPD